MIIGKKGTIRKDLIVPGDKSISHRAVMLGSIANGVTHISGFLNADDCLSTISCMRSLGVKIEHEGDEVTVHGVGLHGLKEPYGVLDCGNSGTTTRLLSGILSGMDFSSRLTGDSSIRKRPMERIMTPLRLMGADISSENDNGCAPLIINPSSLHGITYDLPVSSSQVKSCIIFASLYSNGRTIINEPSLSRDHTERMLKAMGADIRSEGLTVTLDPGKELNAVDVVVPGDISSAAFFMAAALITEGSWVVIRNVGINPTRTGIIKALQDMGGNIDLINKRVAAGEEICDIEVSYSDLHGIELSGDTIPTLIDELPIFAICAAYAKGTTIVKDAKELRYKESDRIGLITRNLKAMGADIEAREDGFIINQNGKRDLHGAVIEDGNDHRIAMSFTVAALSADGETEIVHPECVSISYPGFFKDLLS